MGKKFVDLANLKSNLENFFSEIISPTFATKEDISEQLGNHTVKSDVPENAVFTDTVYDDTGVQKRISDNGYGEVAGGKNLVNLNYDSLMEKESNMSGVTFSYVSPNCIKLNGTSTQDYSNCYMTLLSPTIKDNEGIFSHGKSLTISTTKGYIALYANAGAGWTGLGCYKNFNITIQPEWISLLIRISAKDIGETYNNDLAYIQIEEGSEATSYEPYFPSNKMLAEETVDLDKRLSDNGYGEVAGGKNLATVFSFSTKNNEIIFTKKDDSTLIANGSNYNEGAGLTKTFLAKAGITYTAQIITDLQLNMFIWNSDESTSVTSQTRDKKISFSVAKDTNISIAIDANNVVFNNTEIKVQLEEGSIATEYEPYFPSNKMLAEEKADKSETTVNLLNPTLQTTTQNGVTCTNNGDGTYTLNGTATNANATFDLSFSCSLNSSVKLLGRPKNIDGVMIQTMYNGSWDDPTTWDNTGNGAILSDASKINRLSLFVLKDKSVKNAIIKPMITTNLNATYDDFVPYTGDTGKLNSDVAKLNNDLSASNAGAHNSVYRGKYLGNALTTEQKAQILAGTFNDLYIGDYWTIGGVNYRIAAFDYWLNSGDTTCTTHHVVIVPDSNLYTAKMNDTNITTGAYVGSAMYTVNLAAAKTTINNAFGSKNILSHREYLANATKSTTDPTYESAGSWYDSTVELMNERMVYGADIFHNIEVNGAIPTNYTIDKSQLPLFALEPSRICNRADWWLRDVVSAASFAFVDNYGNATAYAASYYYGIRPVFGIKG